MSRLAGILAVVASVVVGMPAGAWAQTTGPTLTLEPNCYRDLDGSQVYAVDIEVTGLAPNSSFTGRLDSTYINPDGTTSGGGTIGPAVFTADANGTFSVGIGTVGVPTIFTATVEYSGVTLTETLRVTCRPTSKADCTNGGWHSYPDFKNQGDCVNFVARSRPAA